MKSLKVSEIMRISGLTLEEITTRFAKSDIIIKDESQEVSVDEYKRAMASKSTKISLNKPKPKLQLKPKHQPKLSPRPLNPPR